MSVSEHSGVPRCVDFWKRTRHLTEVSHLIDLTNDISQDFLDATVAQSLRVRAA